MNNLIKNITPLYNKYRDNRSNITGTEAIEIMWDIGELLREYIDLEGLAPHALFWSIYGNAEGKKNIEKKSYITREFQGRCYRIRKIFIQKETIKKELPNLKSFTAFREAMPFFDNENYKLEGKDKQNLLTLLNSSQSTKKILERVHILQKEKINITNPRTQRLSDIEEEKKVFIDFYNFIFKTIKSADYTHCINELEGIDNNYIRLLSKNVSALSQEGLKFFDMTIPSHLKVPWKDFSEFILSLLKQTDPKMRRRFRRVIPAERIVKLADMLHALLSPESLTKLKNKL